MSGRDLDLPALRLELAANAGAPTTLQERAQNVLDVLGRMIPFDAAWLAVRDSERGRHTPLATAGEDSTLPPVVAVHRVAPLEALRA